MNTQSRGLGERFFIGLQKLMPRLLLTRLIYRATRIRTPLLKRWTILLFVKAFRVDISDSENPVPDGFLTFNDFFTRALKAGARPLDSAPEALLCPCDGTLSQFGPMENDRLIQAKGVDYDLDELVGDAGVAERFRGGRFATVYLAPYNYHRVHMPVTGTLSYEAHVGEDLFSVNQATARGIPNLFVRNQRRVMVFESAAGPVAVIMVGAMNVGSITTLWSGEQRAGFAKAAEYADTEREGPTLSRGDMLGWFNMGSTVILLTAEKGYELEPRLNRDQLVRMGERIGTCYPVSRE